MTKNNDEYVTHLGKGDYQSLLDEIENPSEPTPYFIESMKRARRRVVNLEKRADTRDALTTVFIVALMNGGGEVDVKGVFTSREDAEENVRDLVVDFGFCATHDGEYDIVIYERTVHRTSDVESHHYDPPVTFVSVDPE